jgi:hypothetical protein
MLCCVVFLTPYVNARGDSANGTNVEASSASAKRNRSGNNPPSCACQQWCHSGVTVVLLWRYCDVTVSLQLCYRNRSGNKPPSCACQQYDMC